MPVIFEHKADTGSNKPDKYGVQLTAKAYWYQRPTGYTVTVMKPIIDRISLTYPVSDPAIRKVIRKHLKEWAKAQDPMISHWAKTPKWGSSKYAHSFAINCKPGTKLLVQLAKEGTNAGFLRVEFNPSALGPLGVQSFRDLIPDLTCNAFTYNDLALGCRVTRIDVAVDLVNIEPEDLLIKASKPGVKMAYFGLSGDLETSYLNVTKKGSKLYVYDRKTLLKKQQQEGQGKGSPYGEAEYTRVEVRLTPEKPITKLASMHNPLTKLDLIDIEAPVPPESEHHWRLFQDSCRYRGLENALDLLPTGTREAYLAAVQAAQGQVWRPNTLWGHWSDALLKSAVMAGAGQGSGG